jgi:hypothetical protein
MKFAAGKIERELRKGQDKFLGQQLMGKTRSGITNTLSTIADSFRIISSIEMTKFEPDKENLSITLETYVNDLVDNHMTLDFTLNYNKNND